MSLNKLSRAETLSFSAIGISVLTLLITILGSGSRPATSTHSTQDELPSAPVVSANTGNVLQQISATSARVAKLAEKSVVRIESSFRNNSRTTDDLESYFGKLPQERLGSGVVIDAQGLVVTNYHVVRGAESVSIVSQEGTTYQATVIGHDALTDFALLQVPNLRLPAIAWGDSDLVETGHFVWAIGCPFGLDQSVSMGIVSSTHRPTILDSPFQDFFQTDASINPGNSGGALVDAEGHLIGINTAITGDSFQGISFALPSNTAREVTEQLKSGGQIPRGWIGVQLGAVTPSRAAMAGLENSMGAYVESLVNGNSSPASAAGIQVGDICTEFNGQSVFGPLGLLRQIAKQPIGSQAKITVIRGGMTLELEVAVTERPRT